MSTSNEPIFLGINIAGGAAYLGTVRAPREILVADQADRILPNDGLDRPLRLEDFRARLAQEMRRLQPAKVGVARTRMFKNWTMKAASNRFGFEAAAMLAAVQEGFDCELVRQEDAAKAVGVPIEKVPELLPAALGISKTPYWKDRAAAFLVARHLAGETS
jgi:hypothetical protein